MVTWRGWSVHSIRACLLAKGVCTYSMLSAILSYSIHADNLCVILISKLFSSYDTLHIEGTHKIDEPRFDEDGYIAMPPCLWGSPEDGLLPPPFMNNMTIKVTALTNNTYGHHGEMALPEISLITM